MLTRINLRIIAGIFILFLTMLASAWFIVTKDYEWIALMVLPIIIVLWYIFRQQQKIFTELNEFTESIRYGDFSRRFSVRKGPVEIRLMRKDFNEISDAFRDINREKETQYQYLQRIMEMVNTGILSYDAETGKVQWMNESLKQLLHIPYLKNITGIEKRNKVLYDDLISVRAGDTKISTFHSGMETTKILISATAFQTDDKKYILAGFQNISNAVSETESEAWRKLLRVMTHEIMNSVAPISSLAGTLQGRVREHIASHPTEDGINLNDISTGVDTIKKRSDSLLKFAETYRSLNKIRIPELKTFLVRDLFENISTLMEPTLEQKNIHLEILLKDVDLSLCADASLVEQVVINLVVNAAEAVKDKPEKLITLSGEAANDKILLRVSDNGCGMPADVLDKIFVPFFTTKASGSGIGLSLGRQIMQAHRGAIQVASEVGKGTVFTLQFPARV